MFCLGLGSLMLLPERDVSRTWCGASRCAAWATASSCRRTTRKCSPTRREPHRHGLWRAVDGRTTGQSIGAALVAVVIALTGGIGDGAGASFAYNVRPGLCDRGAVAGRQPGAGIGGGMGRNRPPSRPSPPPQHFSSVASTFGSSCRLVCQTSRSGRPGASQPGSTWTRRPSRRASPASQVASWAMPQPAITASSWASASPSVIAPSIGMLPPMAAARPAGGISPSGTRQAAAPSARAYATASWRESSSTSFGAPRRSR